MAIHTGNSLLPPNRRTFEVVPEPGNAQGAGMSFKVVIVRNADGERARGEVMIW
jgi:hypothetical protein